jgi:uncharacterized protein YrrD
VDRVVIDPGTLKVTHVVVQKGLLFTRDKVIPAEWITSTSEDEVILKPDIVDFDALPDFKETNFILLEEGDPERAAMVADYVAQPYYWYPPIGFGTTVTPAVGGGPVVRKETEQNIPENTVALKEGAGVLDKNGDQVGNVERIYTDSRTRNVTHFVISSGFLFKERKLIPVHWVTLFEEDKVHLSVGSRFLDRLPPFPETA